MALQLTQTHYPSVQYYLNSLASADTTKSAVAFNFAERVRVPSVYAAYISIVDFKFPVSFYNVNANNNTLVLGLNGTQVTYSVPVGNYDACALAAAIRVAYGGVHVCAEYDPYANKMRLMGTQAFTLYPTGTLNKTIGFASGLVSSVLYGGTAPPASSYLDGIYAVDLSGTRTISVHSSFRTPNMDTVSLTNTTVLGKFPVEAEFGAMQVYKNLSGFRSKTNDLDNLNSFDIQICDDWNNRIDFRNADWSMTLQVDFVYSQNEPIYSNPSILDVVAEEQQQQIRPEMLPTSDGFDNNIDAIVQKDSALANE